MPSPAHPGGAARRAEDRRVSVGHHGTVHPAAAGGAQARAAAGAIEPHLPPPRPRPRANRDETRRPEAALERSPAVPAETRLRDYGFENADERRCNADERRENLEGSFRAKRRHYPPQARPNISLLFCVHLRCICVHLRFQSPLPLMNLVVQAPEVETADLKALHRISRGEAI